MALFKNVRGTLETIFQIGIGGPQIKDNAGTLEARDSADAAFVILRGLTPVGADDLATKSYVDGVVTGADALQVIRFTVDGTAAATSILSGTVVPDAARVSKVRVEITTAWTSAFTMQVGSEGTTANLLMGTTENDLDSASGNVYEKDIDIDWDGVGKKVEVTLSAGSDATGAAVVSIWYATPST